MRRYIRARTQVPVLLATILLIVCAGLKVIPVAARSGQEIAQPYHLHRPIARYVGWAMEGYPQDGSTKMAAMVHRQLLAGSNLVWIGQNNPGEVSLTKREPALSYAVYAAAQDNHDPLHTAALAIIDAQRRLLEACRTAGVATVLPVGYQIEMGAAWNAAHPHDLRLDAQGHPWSPFGGKPNATYLSPAYQRDITRYYQWVDATFVRPFRSTIIMLDLADEPSGGDYSAWADHAFQVQTGYSFAQVGSNPLRQQALGAFETHYMVGYATWSARAWQQLEKSLMVTMSFDGGQSRYAAQDPVLEPLFRETPTNFAVTFDAYPRDGLFDTPLHATDLIALYAFVRTLGYLSNQYHRPLWFWSAGNSWGLNEASADPGNVADAMANIINLAQLATQTGGDLRGIAVWNYNVRDQGLYNDSHHTVYAPDAMFTRLSATFSTVRAIFTAPPGLPDTLLLAPQSPADELMGQTRAVHALDPYHWTELAFLARHNVPAAAVSTLGGYNLSSIQRVIILSANPADLSQSDWATLTVLIQRGTRVVGSSDVIAHIQCLAAHGPAPTSTAVPPTSIVTSGPAITSTTIVSSGLSSREMCPLAAQPTTLQGNASSSAGRLTGKGQFYTASGDDIAAAFDDAHISLNRAALADLFGQANPGDGFTVVSGGVVVLYNISPATTTVRGQVADGTSWTNGQLIAASGERRASLPVAGPGTGITVAVLLRHREMAMYQVTPHQ